MRAREIQPQKLVVFDIDDTLVHTQTQVHVIRDGRVIRSLNSHDFTHYRLQPGESFDFADFRNAREFFEKSRPIIPMMNQLKHDINTGNRVVMVTARADFDDKELFLDTFRKYGIDMSRVHVYRAGNMTGASTEEKKKKIIRDLLNRGSYTKAIMYDDAVPNLNSFMELKQEYPDTRFYAWHVDPEGRAREFARESVELAEQAIDPQAINTVLSKVKQAMERVDDLSMDERITPAQEEKLEKDYQALTAIEAVLKNHIIAIKRGTLDHNIFMYNYHGNVAKMSAIHVELVGTQAHVLWLGSIGEPGAGRELYTRAAKEALQRGAKTIRVEAKWNSAGFYQRMGLQKTAQGEYNPFSDSSISHFAGNLNTKESVAEASTVHYNGIDISLEIQKDDEYVDDEDYDNQVVYVTASSNGRELGHVLFVFDGEYLLPQDLEVDARYRGTGIAQTMYDYVTSRGYKIRRSGQQTDAGAGFWDRHRPSQNVWEQQKKELVKEVNDQDELAVSERIQDYFFSKGYKYVGEGRDQIVFKSPRNTIVKVLGVGDPDREQAVRDYVAFFQANQRNPYYPRIYNSGEFQIGGETYFVYETEYLEYVASEEATLEYIEDLMTAMSRGQMGLDAFMKNKPRAAGISEQELAGLINATEDIIDGLVGPKGYNLDLGQIENIRRRANGQLVIVDPVSVF
jgi:GNAT superfamily N-acetyltransferase